MRGAASPFLSRERGVDIVCGLSALRPRHTPLPRNAAASCRPRRRCGGVRRGAPVTISAWPSRPILSLLPRGPQRAGFGVCLLSREPCVSPGPARTAGDPERRRRTGVPGTRVPRRRAIREPETGRKQPSPRPASRTGQGAAAQPPVSERPDPGWPIQNLRVDPQRKILTWDLNGNASDITCSVNGKPETQAHRRDPAAQRRNVNSVAAETAFRNLRRPPARSNQSCGLDFEVAVSRCDTFNLTVTVKKPRWFSASIQRPPPGEVPCPRRPLPSGDRSDGCQPA
ncbi:PREDICTED: uncharacterized protein LOC105854645 [Condylura cristata]|uniref:uncharacterized protein LOC105854645 n=1 Tax=Condylura cristata TaxID=143302 RepID=UPI0006438C88|nr:PREDICTED: uncharacterized protein LOC105854645 [Condylura cristata]